MIKKNIKFKKFIPVILNSQFQKFRSKSYVLNKIRKRSKQLARRAAFENEVARLEQERFEIVRAVNKTMDDFFHDFLSLFEKIVISLKFRLASKSKTRVLCLESGGRCLAPALKHVKVVSQRRPLLFSRFCRTSWTLTRSLIERDPLLFV